MFMSKTTELLNSALLLQLGDATSSVLSGRLRPMTGMGGGPTYAGAMVNRRVSPKADISLQLGSARSTLASFRRRSVLVCSQSAIGKPGPLWIR